jgi:hypothetical protein
MLAALALPLPAAIRAQPGQRQGDAVRRTGDTGAHAALVQNDDWRRGMSCPTCRAAPA